MQGLAGHATEACDELMSSQAAVPLRAHRAGSLCTIIPVFPPDSHAEAVLAWLAGNPLVVLPV
jgi:hypothetical protein